MMDRRDFVAGLGAAGAALAGVGRTAAQDASQGDAPLRSLVSFPVGVAVPAGAARNSLLGSPERQALVQRHFNSLTAENIMKMAYLQPEPGRFRFEQADALIAWAKANGLIVHGHTLLWHNQAPRWMNEFKGSRDQFIAMMNAHVTAVARHFAGKLVSWDVVNEAFTDGKPTAYRDSIWFRNIGPEYIEMAFRTARAADAKADLYYNDYDVEGAIGPEKLERILVMADDFKARGVPLDGIGFQMHIDTDKPGAAQIREACAKVVRRGLKVRISELDISVNQSKQYQQFSPELAQLQRLRYQESAQAYLDAVPPPLRGGITLWGLTDGDSWIPGFKKRPDWPLLFDAQFKPKPALAGFAQGLRSS
jgi:endo-1,4-beta-xylanase